jgi:two-component system chemotaxis response regulator CheY
MAFDVPAKDKPVRGRVLVVDDEEHARKTVRMTLENVGYEVVEANDGGKAITVLNADDNPLRVDLIICDIRMPKVNGVEAISYFRSQYPSIPVVVLTAYPETAQAVSFLKQGVVDYVTKPVESGILTDVVANAMKHRAELTG